MTPKELRDIADSIANSTKQQLLSYAIILVVILLTGLILQYLTSRLQSISTKKDLEKITRISEEVKAQISNNQDIYKTKYVLKYNTLLKSLELVDAFTSNYWLSSASMRIDKQFANIEEYRGCHNQLIITCDNEILVNTFYELMFAKSNNLGLHLRNLETYRNLVRAELGFGNNLNLDPDKIWFGSINSSKPLNEVIKVVN